MAAPDYVEPIVGMRSWRLRDRILRPVNRMDRFARYQGRAMTDHFRDTFMRLDQWTPGVAHGAVCGAQEVYQKFVLNPPAVLSVGSSLSLGADPLDEMMDCRNARHPGKESPVEDCTCGHYATYDSTKVPIPPVNDREELIVIGQVLLWGRVIEHQNGWRAQYAYPGNVWVLPFSWTPGARTYFCDSIPVITFDRVERAARDLSATYGINAEPMSPRSMDAPPWGPLRRVNLVDEDGKLSASARRVPTSSEQHVRPWVHPPGQYICVRCATPHHVGPGGRLYACRCEVDPWLRYQMRGPFDYSILRGLDLS